MLWGASQKMSPSLAGNDKAEQAPELAITHMEGINESLDLSTLSWEEFHHIYHPQFSELTDEALYQLYKELKRYIDTDGKDNIGHSGSDPGILTLLFFDP